MLAGSITPTLISALPNVRLEALRVDGVATGSLTVSDSPLFSYALHEADGVYDVSIADAHFDTPGFDLTGKHAALGNLLETVFDAGKTELGAFFAGLDGAARDKAESYRGALDQLSPRSVMTVFSRAAADASKIADRSMSCPTFEKGYTGTDAFLTEGSCAYFMTGGRITTDRGDSERADSRIKAAFWQVGAQTEVAPNLFLGGSLAYQADWVNADDGVSGKGSTGQGAVTLKYQTGPVLLTAAAFGNIGSYDLTRNISLPGFSETAKGSPSFYSGGLRARAAYTLGSESLYLRPYLNVDWVHAHSDSFKERGAGDLGLAFDDASYNTVVFTPAVEFGSRAALGDEMVLRSFVSAGVSLRTTDNWKGKADLRGAAGGGSVSVDAPVESTAARLGAGLQLFQGDRTDVRVQYDGEFSRRAITHGGTVSFAYRF